MASLRNNPEMPTVVAERTSRRGRPPKPVEERRDYLVQVALTADEYAALMKYKVLKAQPHESATGRAAIVSELRNCKLLKPPPKTK